jgi:hypothetical protein
MNGSVIRSPSRSLKEQFSRSSEAWKEQSDPIFRFWAEGDWWGFPFFSLSASRYFGEKQTLCLYWPLATVVIAGPKVLDFTLCFAPTAQLSQGRWKRHQGLESDTRWRFGRGVELHLKTVKQDPRVLSISDLSTVRKSVRAERAICSR